MSQTAKANEPSMEEILASIRRIIADDEPAKPAPAKAAAPPPPPPPPEPAAEEGPKSQDDIDALLAGFDALEEEPAPPPPPPPPAPPKQAAPEPEPEILELSKADAVPERMGMIKPIAQRSDLDFVDAPPPPPPPPPVQAYAPPPPANASLLSAEAHAAVGAAFGSLASSMMVGSNRTLEDVLKDMLRPMLKTWLDDNLPQLVERLVRAEIERVSRGPGR